MMRYIPNSHVDCSRMIRDIGLDCCETLFSHIPRDLRFEGMLDVPGPYSEPDLIRIFNGLAANNTHIDLQNIFLGAGAYAHFIPAAVDALISRFEFSTAYTPYQAEICQGTLQAIFEFQTLICQLTGMDVANASLYDGSSAVTEGVLMSLRLGRGRKKVALSSALNPLYRSVLETNLHNLDVQVVEVPHTEEGIIDTGVAENMMDDSTACLVVQHPNFFGRLEPMSDIVDVAHQAGALCVAAVSEPVSMGLLEPPGAFGVDLVVGNGASFGNQLIFGGPGLGFIACRQKYLRNLPGRLAGQTVDELDRTGYVLTLSTREQHIRRDRATSNICTNQALCALSATIFMALMGETGSRELARQNVLKTDYARKRLTAIDGVEDRFPGPCFNEFVLTVPGDPEQVSRALAGKGIIGGLPLGNHYNDLARGMLFCTTEVNSRAAIDRLADEVEEAL